MSLFIRFNLIAFILFLSGVLIAGYLALRDVRDRVHADIIRTSVLADYLIESQKLRLQSDYQRYGELPDKKAIKRIFNLVQLKQLEHLRIQFVASDGQLIDSNQIEVRPSPAIVPDRLFNFLSEYLYEPPVIKPFSLAGTHIGDLTISHDLNSEIDEIWQTSLAIIIPIILVFFLGNLLIAILASFIFNPAEKLLQVSQRLNNIPERQQKKFFRWSGFIHAGHQLDDIGEQLLHYNRQLKQLNYEMLNVHEQERKRLSAELHDEIGQHLTAIRFDTATIKSTNDLTEARQAAKSVESISQQLTEIIRTMLKRLRPPLLDSIGLSASMAEMTHEWQSRNPQHVLLLKITGNTSRIDDATSLVLFRAMQECLTNISRYAGESAMVNITLNCSEHFVMLTVTDNGDGCQNIENTDGLGLIGMRERVEALSGNIKISTASGQGMRITLELPIKSGA